MTKILLSIVLLTSGLCASAQNAKPWTRVFRDDFNRKALGPNWLILRGEWHINKKGQLQIQRQWPSHSYIMSMVPLRGKNVKVEFDIQVPSSLLYFRTRKGRAPMTESGVEFHLQAGALHWGAGGVDDRVGVKILACPKEKLGNARKQRKIAIALDTVVRAKMLLVNGSYSVSLDGKEVARGTTPQGRSIINSELQIAAVPCLVIDNVEISTQEMAKPLPEINAATAADNKKATVFAEGFIDMKKPDCGIQAAINSLPPGGGVVILPKGRFLLRRHLELRSHTALIGQGPDTILQAMDFTISPVEKAFVENGQKKLVVTRPHDFRAGDAFSYGRRMAWGHPMSTKSRNLNRLLVTAVDGNTLTVNAPLSGTPGRIGHFFPPVCSFESEFVEVRDLTIRGPKNYPKKARGGFEVNPITFGVTSNPRFSRLVIDSFPADGISAQVCDDARFLDCTIRGVHSGMHPGTSTMRTMVARNYSVNNKSGLYFCWYNSNGIYFRNYVKDFTGYPDAGDAFNTLTCNRFTNPMTITVGYNGCVFANRGPAMQISIPKAKNGPGSKTYNVAARYFTLGNNRFDNIVLIENAYGNIIANNTSNGRPSAFHCRRHGKGASGPGKLAKTIHVNDQTKPINGVPGAIKRSSPLMPPTLPQPVLDGRTIYQAAAPDCGFQKALDKLAARGGTLQLPGGRYALSTPLKIPSHVTLVGYGTATVLLPKGTTKSLIIVSNSNGVVLRDFAIEGTWSTRMQRSAAIDVASAQDLSIIAIDVRGWSGNGIQARNAKGLAIQDCRVLRCTGTGYLFKDVNKLVAQTNSAVRGTTGFSVRACTGAKLFGNIAGPNYQTGYHIASDNALIAGNNANNCGNDGILIKHAKGVVISGNTCSSNNQNDKNCAGIRLAGNSSSCRVLYNNCGDDQLLATQAIGILEETGARKNEICFNNTAPLCASSKAGQPPSLVTMGEQSVIRDNWTKTILPTNDSVESIKWLRKTHK